MLMRILYQTRCKTNANEEDFYSIIHHKSNWFSLEEPPHGGCTTEVMKNETIQCNFKVIKQNRRLGDTISFIFIFQYTLIFAFN